MKIKTLNISYDDVCKLPMMKHKNPCNPNPLLRLLIETLAKSELKKVNFKSETVGMEKLTKDEPCLVLMNHSSFIDLKIASVLLHHRPYHIVCTTDGFVGKELLMRQIGCIPTQKFVTDPGLIRDMKYALKKLKNSVLMFPEASYSFDGRSSTLPESLGKCIKLLDVPVVLILTKGAFLRDPLYNMLQLRQVDVSANMTYLLSRDDIKSMSADEINSLLKEKFSFDNFRMQQEANIRIDAKFRADGLNRVLYKCSECEHEGCMEGRGTTIKCRECGSEYKLDEYGYLKNLRGSTRFRHIPDWYQWERECVRKLIEEGKYKLEIAVDIIMLVNMKAVYRIGEGILTHDYTGFRLIGCDGKLDYTRRPGDSYSLYSDYFWYEIGDMICIGDSKKSFYCFPKNQKDVVAKARLAAEELYNYTRAQRMKK